MIEVIEHAFVMDETVRISFQHEYLTCEITGQIDYVKLDKYFVVESDSKPYLIQFGQLISVDYIE